MTAPSPSAPPPSPPMSGLVYADVPNRAIAFIIDYIVLILIMIVVGIVLATIGLATGSIGSTGAVSTLGSIVAAVIGLVVAAGYFIWTWTTRRATLGMQLLGMQIGNAGDGKTLTTDQAIRRYLALAAPSILATRG